MDHKFDLSHFRNDSGNSVAVDTVKIICWAADPAEKEGAFAAKAWIEGLIEKMGMQGTVTARNIKDRKATIAVDSESARFLVGRGGSTLQAIQLMLNTAMAEEYSDWTFDIDVKEAAERSVVAVMIVVMIAVVVVTVIAVVVVIAVVIQIVI